MLVAWSSHGWSSSASACHFLWRLSDGTVTSPIHPLAPNPRIRGRKERVKREKKKERSHLPQLGEDLSHTCTRNVSFFRQSSLHRFHRPHSPTPNQEVQPSQVDDTQHRSPPKLALNTKVAFARSPHLAPDQVFGSAHPSSKGGRATLEGNGLFLAPAQEATEYHHHRCPRCPRRRRRRDTLAAAAAVGGPRGLARAREFGSQH